MTLASLKLFYFTTCAVMCLFMLTGCPPGDQQGGQQAGTFIVSKNKLFDASSEFDLRWTAVYPKPEDRFNPSINVSDQELAFSRCTNCHECGFKPAFDYENFGKPGWKPVYTGNQWVEVVKRMNQKDGAMLNEEIAGRIFKFLSEATVGKYDQSADDKGAIVVEVSPEDAGRIPQHPAAGSDPAPAPAEGGAGG